MLDTIAELARTKTFDALDPAEQQLVLAEMTEAEYRELRRMLLFFKNSEADIEPPPGLKNELLDRFQRTRGRSHGQPFLGFFRTPIPMWKAAAAVLLALGATFFLKNKKPAEVVEVPVFQTVVRVDTVWKTEIRWRERVVVRHEKLPQLPADALVETAVPKADFQEISKVENWATPDVGSPISDQPELFDFFNSAGEVGGEKRKD